VPFALLIISFKFSPQNLDKRRYQQTDVCNAGLPDFSWLSIPKRGKYTKVPLNYQMAKEYTLCL
jgi:hypothetical protein